MHKFIFSIVVICGITYSFGMEKRDKLPIDYGEMTKTLREKINQRYAETPSLHEEFVRHNNDADQIKKNYEENNTKERNKDIE